MARPRGLEPLTYGLAYHCSFHCLKVCQSRDSYYSFPICGLDYIFTISGGTRIVSTDPGMFSSLLYQRLGAHSIRYGFTATGFLGIAGARITLNATVSPIQCPPLRPFTFPDEGSYTTNLTKCQASAEGRCSIRLSYGRHEG